eukprot:CAMPEP_0117685232 /NCGR_PEP_ID=MMETSP0804-20121206/21615_1 /TAXON_ID=1074897 /ORGANISM="Tetraselmis astigmatica, Strain CCMP880" /LENGTH=537 /DNA_ID=CAMNT_0005496461 /DNA_START=195 /DNA_END=1809 /DNA_ORIENTATION=-
MRQVIVTAPFDKADLVVEAMQSVGAGSILRYNAEVAAVVTTYASPHMSGYILHELDKIGCGSAYGRIALTPVEVLKPLPKARIYATSEDDDKAVSDACGEKKVPDETTVGARLAIEEIYSDVQANSTITFDYMAFIVIGSMIAGLGLATNNTVMILASMLVSPLMGPILAFTFGSVVKDRSLVMEGVKMELVGVVWMGPLSPPPLHSWLPIAMLAWNQSSFDPPLPCPELAGADGDYNHSIALQGLTILVGFIMGLLLAEWGVLYQWPTNEMTTRGEWSSLVIGILFAVPSGAGVALSVTGGGSNSLVGVAIAASLLPPVVNTGLCLAYAALGPALHGEEADAKTFVQIGMLSFLLFLINVGAIYIVCVIFFKIKKIGPVRRQLTNWTEIPKLIVPKDESKVPLEDSVELKAESAIAATAAPAGPPQFLRKIWGGNQPSPEEIKERAQGRWKSLKATLHKDVEGESGEGSADSELESEVPLKTAPQGQGFLSNILGGDPSPEEVKQRAEDRLENMKSSELDGQQDGSSSGIGSDTLV